jgi:hypothetical protein
VKLSELQQMNSAGLVERFTQVAVAQDNALLGSERSKFNRLFREMMQVVDE